MCGIAGILTRADLDNPEFAKRLDLMTERLGHRGPDDSGTTVFSPAEGWQLYLGHRRLSIIDVSSNGHQPMGDPSSGSWITYNGEIYNHRALRAGLTDADFLSTSDTESLLRAWVERGPDVTDELRGIFAFALYDGRRRQFWLARDRLGVKPLYIARPTPDLLLFASEVRAILASGLVPRRLSRQALTGYLAFGAVQAPHTIVEGIQSLLPGERVCIELTAQKMDWVSQRYWRPPFCDTQAASATRNGAPMAADHREALLERLQPVFDEAVKSRFLADVPIGVFLSGGIDSSAIVASASRQQLQPDTFSISFDEAEFDESEHAIAVARACDVRHTVLTVTSQDMLADLDHALASYDQPSSDGLNTYTISKAARDAGLKAALSGLGGDEAFAGYNNFHKLRAIDRWIRCCGGLCGPRSRALCGKFIGNSGQLWRAVQLVGFSATRLDAYAVLRQFYSQERIGKLLAAGGSPTFGLDESLFAELEYQVRDTDVVNATSLLEMSLYMHNVLLRDTDQMSMARGLEVRVPLLDHLLIAEVARLPGQVKLPVSRTVNKWLLVEMVKELVPPEVVRRRKMGFVFPWARWLRGELRGFVDEHLLDGELVEAAGLRPAEVAKIWQAYLQQQRGVRYADILALLNLVHWCQANGVVAG